jgi:hypothetical protein
MYGLKGGFAEGWPRGSRNSGQQAREASDGLGVIEAHLSASRRGGLRLCAAAVVARVGRGRRAWRSGVLVFRVVSEGERVGR